jgi:hypothetical protein
MLQPPLSEMRVYGQMSIHVKLSNKGLKTDEPNKLSNIGYFLNGLNIH